MRISLKRLFKRDWMLCHPWGPKGSNFGDLMGPWLYQKITGKKARCIRKEDLETFPKSRPLLLTCGSLIQAKLVRENCVIWGSGIITRKNMPMRKPMAVHAVRGPLTRSFFLSEKIPCPDVFGDPAILAPVFYQPKVSRAWPVGIIPHYSCHAKVKELFEHRLDEIRVIDVDRPVESVIDDIAACEITFSSSLHGIIVSHAYQIPCQWVQALGPLAGDGVKFLDYFLSIGRREEEVIPAFFPDLAHLTISEMRQRAVVAPRPLNLPSKDALLEACPFR